VIVATWPPLTSRIFLYNALTVVDDKMCAIRQKKALLEKKKGEIAAHRAKLLELANNGGCRMTRAMKYSESTRWFIVQMKFVRCILRKI
jgi:hypothetical protein